MIPKTLLIAFLSLQGQDQSSPTASQFDVKVFDASTSPVNLQDINGLYEPGSVQYSSNVNQQPLGCQATVGPTYNTYPFDSLASGAWDNDFILQGVQITNNDTSRLWSLPDAFPSIKAKHGGHKAWGPYPQGNKFTVKFDREWSNVHWTFGWVVNGQLSGGAYTTTGRKDGKWVAAGGGKWGNGEWASWSSGYAIDQIDVQVTEGIPTGLLLLEHVTWS